MRISQKWTSIYIHGRFIKLGTNDMATEEKKKPVKGILKSSSSFDHEKHKEQKDKHDKEMKWDEMNILATHHPPDKDYGHMKIDEPPTPYSKSSDVEDDDDEEEDGDKSAGGSGMGDILPEDIANRLAETQRPRATSFSEGDDSSEDENETEEDRAKRKQFEQKRKLHYNEFQAVILAKQLMEEEEEEDEDENNEVTTKSEVIQPMEENSTSNSIKESS